MSTVEELDKRIVDFQELDLDGGHLALDFVNTVDWRGTKREIEWLVTPTHVAAWLVRVGLIDRAPVASLLAPDDRNASTGATHQSEILLHIRRRREELNSVLRAVVEDRELPQNEWRSFNEFAAGAMSRARLEKLDGGFAWHFPDLYKRLDGFLDLVHKEAAELLVGPNLSRLKLCGAEGCGWYFIDTTKNGQRHWCSRGCANRVNVKRHYYRHRNRDAHDGPT